MTREVRKNNVSFLVGGETDFWDDFESGKWEPHTFKIIDTFLKKGHDKVAFDIGGLNAVITLYCSGKGAKTYCFEPDPVAIQKINTNLALNPSMNGKIVFIPKALSGDGKNITLFSRWEFGESGSSVLQRVRSRNQAVEVKSITFENVLKDFSISKIDFLKMDIEGAEFFVIDSMIASLKELQPTFYLSLHFNNLLEFYEKSKFPSGILRNIYRLLDPGKKYLRKLVIKRYQQIFNSINFYSYCYDQDFKKLDVKNLNSEELEKLDSIIFSNIEI